MKALNRFLASVLLGICHIERTDTATARQPNFLLVIFRHMALGPAL